MKPDIAPQFTPPDADLIQELTAALPASVNVSTRFLPKVETPQVVVLLAGTSPRNNGTSIMAAFNIRVTAKKYLETEETAYAVVDALNNIDSAPFHWVEVQSLPIFFREDGVSLEQRLITVQALISAV